MPHYSIEPAQRLQLSAAFVLDKLFNGYTVIPADIGSDNAVILPILHRLRHGHLVDIHEDRGVYMPTLKGRDCLGRYLARLQEGIQLMDHYSHVHPKTLAFAYDQYFDLSEDEWEEYLLGGTWIDARVAVAQFKGIDPIEMLFMNKTFYGLDEDEEQLWQQRIGSGKVFNDICSVANRVPSLESLGSEWVEQIIRKGSEVMIKLIREDNELREEKDRMGFDDDEEEETGECCSYYDQPRTDDDDEDEDENDLKVESNPHLVQIIVEPYPEPHFRPYIENPRYVSNLWRESWHFPL